jgi:hypothetical protein
VRKADDLSHLSQLSGKRGALDVLQPYRPLRHVTGMALLFLYLTCIIQNVRAVRQRSSMYPSCYAVGVWTTGTSHIQLCPQDWRSFVQCTMQLGATLSERLVIQLKGPQLLRCFVLRSSIQYTTRTEGVYTRPFRLLSR